MRINAELYRKITKFESNSQHIVGNSDMFTS